MTKRSSWRSAVTAVAAIGAVALIALTSVAQSERPWSWGPVLGAVGEDSVALTWETIRPVGFDFNYSMAKIYDSTQTWEETLTYDAHEGVAEIWLHDLLPGTTYRYQIVFYEGDAVYPTEVGTFETLDPNARSFSFAVYGATASYPDRHKLVADTIAEQSDVSLVFHTGGLVEYPTEERFDNFFWAMSDLGRTRPYLTVIGDHDADEDLYYEDFVLPPGGGVHDEQWWSFDDGPVHFVGLDSTVSDDADLSAMQEETAWLKQDLSQARADGLIIVVLCADPPYSSSYTTGEDEALVTSWVPVFQRYGVAIVFSSSIHCYEHLYRHGIHYIVTGGGGAPLASQPSGTALGTVFRRYGLLHYIVGTVADDALRIEVIPVATVADDTLTLSSSGRSIDTFVVQGED